MPLLELGQRRPVGVQLLDGQRDRPVQPLGLAAGRPGLGAELPELLGHGRHPGVRLVQPVQGRLHVPGRDGLLVQRRLQGEPGPVDPVAGLAEPGGGLVDRGLHLEQARRRGRPAGRVLPAEQVTLAGDGHQAGLGLDRPPRGGRSSTTATPASRRVTAGRSAAGTVTTSSADRAPGGSGVTGNRRTPEP